MAVFFDDVTTSKELDIRNAKCAPGVFAAEARGRFKIKKRFA